MIPSDRSTPFLSERARQLHYAQRRITQKTKARYEALDETIRSKQSRRAKIEAFLEALAKAELVDNFDTALWCGLVDFVTVHSKDDVRFTFKNGQEIRA